MEILRIAILKYSRRKKNQKVENTATSHKTSAVSIAILKDIERKKKRKRPVSAPRVEHTGHCSEILTKTTL